MMWITLPSKKSQVPGMRLGDGGTLSRCRVDILPLEDLVHPRGSNSLVLGTGTTKLDPELPASAFV